jgi:hypothetical protein
MAGNMADIAWIGGRKYWAGGPYSGQPVDSTPANAGDLTPYLSNPSAPDPTGRVTPTWAQPQTSVPTWAQGPHYSADLPRNPWQNVLEGKPAQNFNPGSKFGFGKETLPSMQRWNRLAPSEQQGAAGYWQDQLGVSADDVFGLMQKLKPAGAYTNAPRWAGGY